MVLYGATSRGSGALDLNGSLTIDGGTIAAVGSAVTPSEDSGQGWLSAAVESPVAAGTTLHVVDGDDKVVTTFVTAREIQVVTFSSAEHQERRGIQDLCRWHRRRRQRGRADGRGQARLGDPDRDGHRGRGGRGRNGRPGRRTSAPLTGRGAPDRPDQRQSRT